MLHGFIAHMHDPTIQEDKTMSHQDTVPKTVAFLHVMLDQLARQGEVFLTGRSCDLDEVAKATCQHGSQALWVFDDCSLPSYPRDTLNLCP